MKSEDERRGMSMKGAVGSLRLHWFIARHYLGAGRGRGLLSLITWIALGGVTVGVTALVIVIAVMTGMQEDLQSKILESTAHVVVLEAGTSLRLQDYPTVLAEIRATEHVTGAAPFVQSEVSIIRSGAGAGYPQSADLFGIAFDTVGVPATEMVGKIMEGVYNLEPPESGMSPLLMGIALASRMQLFIGDTIVVVAFENLKADIFGGLVPTLRQFEITGTFETGMYDYDMKNVYTSLEDAQDLVGIDDPHTVGGIGIRTSDPDIAQTVKNELVETLGYPYWAQSWVETNQALFSALKLEKIAMGLILGLIVLVAAMNIVSTLVMVVADRTREIGILKAMGLTRAGILRVFVLQGAWIGVVGTLLGTTLGVVLALLIDRYDIIKIDPGIYFVESLPVSIYAPDVLKIVLGSIVISVLATIYPAIQASRLEPVDAIRHD
jgi:lipoprotein-releasing system permease protein